MHDAGLCNCRDIETPYVSIRNTEKPLREVQNRHGHESPPRCAGARTAGAL